MVGVSLDNCAQTDHRHVFLGSRQPLGDERNLERTWDPDEIDSLVGYAAGLERLQGASNEPIDNLLVELGRHDGKSAGGGGQVALDDGHGLPPRSRYVKACVPALLDPNRPTPSSRDNRCPNVARPTNLLQEA